MAENPKFNEYKDQIIKVLAKMFDYLALNGDFKVEEKGQRIAVAISSDNAGRIIGRKGQTLESLQLLLNRMMFKMDENTPHISLDIDGYASGDRENKEAAIEADGENGEAREYRRRPRRNGGDAPHDGDHSSDALPHGDDDRSNGALPHGDDDRSNGAPPHDGGGRSSDAPHRGVGDDGDHSSDALPHVPIPRP